MIRIDLRGEVNRTRPEQEDEKKRALRNPGGYPTRAFLLRPKGSGRASICGDETSQPLTEKPSRMSAPALCSAKTDIVRPRSPEHHSHSETAGAFSGFRRFPPILAPAPDAPHRRGERECVRSNAVPYARYRVSSGWSDFISASQPLSSSVAIEATGSRRIAEPRGLSFTRK